MQCENCVNFNWEQAAKYFGHPCNLHGLCKDICKDYDNVDRDNKRKEEKMTESH